MRAPNLFFRLAMSMATVAAFVLATPQARAQTFTLLYSFSGQADGGYPLGGVVRDAVGNLYGTTYNGGRYGFGTLFKVGPSGKETASAT